MIRYKPYEFYRAHYDAFDVTQTKQLATGQRIVTVICYLNTPTKGGGTRFTELEAECAATEGKILVFESVNGPLGGLRRDDLSRHEGCEVGQGTEKFAFTMFFRSQAQRSKVVEDSKSVEDTAVECEDELDGDEAWAKAHPNRSKMRSPWAV